MTVLILALLLSAPQPARLLEVLGPDTLVVAGLPSAPGRRVIDVAGIVAPRPDGACAAERRLAREGIDFTRRFLGDTLLLERLRPARRPGLHYAVVHDRQGRELSRALLRAGYARPFVRGRGTDWCAD